MLMIYVLGAFLVGGIIGYVIWPYIKGWFADSETIFFARLQAAVGAVLQVIFATDLMPIFDAAGLDKYFPAWLLVSGVVTELARRNRGGAQ